MKTADIFAHRGWWRDAAEKNRAVAFRRALDAGFAVETDLRDLDGSVVVSHDAPRSGALEFEAFLDDFGDLQGMALNVKADGLHAQVAGQLARHAVDLSRVFVFDMSVPDTLGYLETGIPVHARHSEYEQHPALLEQAAGVWVDNFSGRFAQAEASSEWLARGLRVTVVSPELHHRPHMDLWRDMRDRGLHERDGFSICTDYPDAAHDFFGVTA